ncbi:MAG: hypothetical protein J7K23_07970 [Thermoproteales archaeon]|nr:hypothetical protein [Thermoproteales archaeon]
MLVYDIPYPPRSIKRNAVSRWYTWYDRSTNKLRTLGYPLQYSVVVVSESDIGKVRDAIRVIEEKRRHLRNNGIDIPDPNIKIIRFSPKTKEDSVILYQLLREWIFATLKTFIESIEEQIKEGKEQTTIEKRVKKFIKKIRKQDFLNIMLRDNEIRTLMLQLEILTS